MSRLKKMADRPRENRRKVSFLLNIGLEVDNFHGDAIQDLDKFKQWIANTFTQWDKSILEYFLYEYGLTQNADNDKYFLDFHIESILDDDTKDVVNPKVEKKLEDDVLNKEEEEEEEEPDNHDKLSDTVKEQLGLDDEK